jgi:hypothetical protein
MGGATSIGHFLAVLGPGGIGARLGGLCDAAQEGYLRRALARGGLGTSTSRAGLEALGFYMCVTDLEDELIRAAGTATVEQIIQAQGELRSFRIFQRQPGSGSAARRSNCAGSWAPGQAARASTRGCWQPRSIRPGFPARSTACSLTRNQPT